MAQHIHGVSVCAAVVLAWCLGAGLVAAARDRTRARAAAAIAAARHADWLARQAARTQLHAFLHDQVLATLTSATRATPEMRPLLARQAETVCRLLDEPADAADTGTVVGLRQFVDQAAELTMRLDPGATFHADVTHPDGHVDGDAVGAFLGALHQAMVNSIAHAGAGARRTVRLVEDDDGVDLTVIDDGCGFELRRVPRSRMGLSVSILGRMRGLRGGSATIEAAPGAGTTVTLRWRREPPAGASEAPSLLRLPGRRLAEARSRAQATSVARAWDQRLRAELAGCRDRIRPLVVPLMERIAAGTALDAPTIERCVLVEARLRDILRGGRLARDALLDAAEAARRRGVEVALIDTAPEAWLSERALAAIVTWAAAELASAAQGPVVVQLGGPSDRGRTSVTTPTGTVIFGGRNGRVRRAVLPTLDEPSDVGERYRQGRRRGRG